MGLLDAYLNAIVRAHSDAITGLYTAPTFREALAQRVIDCRHKGLALSVVALGVDNLQAFNERRGRAMGDEVLTRFGGLICSMLRTDDLGARTRGAGFGIVLGQPHTVQAEQFGRRLIVGARTIAVDYPGSGLALSVGIAHFEAAPPSGELTLQLAEAALHESRRTGQGRVTLVCVGDPENAEPQKQSA